MELLAVIIFLMVFWMVSIIIISNDHNNDKFNFLKKKRGGCTPLLSKTQNFQIMETLKVVTAKELANIMGVSETSAKRYLKDIKDEYQCKRVLGQHVNKYFKIDTKNT